MNKWIIVFLGVFVVICAGKEPFKPVEGSLPFLVYFTSRYRGLCVGTLVSRMVVLTAAVCVANSASNELDTRPINVVTGATYRHPRRGIRMQVTKVIIPKTPKTKATRAYLLEKSVAILLLKRPVPDILAEIPLRAMDVDWKGEEVLSLQEECFIPGWHFFYKGDKIYPIHKFLLQRNVRVQFLNIVKMNEYCDALELRFQKSLTDFGFEGYFDKDAQICVRDPDRSAQPCHGNYGAPLICRGRAVGMLMAPDAQWTNCTGMSNVVHLFNSGYLRNFFTCVNQLFLSDAPVDWAALKKAIYDERDEGYDYWPAMYDKVVGGSNSDSEE